jgi:hypothetical protein
MPSSDTVMPGPEPFPSGEPPSWPPMSTAPTSTHALPPSQDVPVLSPPSSVAQYRQSQEVVDYILWNSEEGDVTLEDPRSILLSDQVSTAWPIVGRSLKSQKLTQGTAR